MERMVGVTKPIWLEKEQRFSTRPFSGRGGEGEASGEEKSGGVGAGDRAAGDEPRKKEEIRRRAAATAHFCLFRETAPLTKWPDKRNRTRGAIARNTRSSWAPAPRVSLERSTTSLTGPPLSRERNGESELRVARGLEKIQRWIPARRR